MNAKSLSTDFQFIQRKGITPPPSDLAHKPPAEGNATPHGHILPFRHVSHPAEEGKSRIGGICPAWGLALPLERAEDEAADAPALQMRSGEQHIDASGRGVRGAESRENGAFGREDSEASGKALAERGRIDIIGSPCRKLIGSVIAAA